MPPMCGWIDGRKPNSAIIKAVSATIIEIANCRRANPRTSLPPLSNSRHWSSRMCELVICVPYAGQLNSDLARDTNISGKALVTVGSETTQIELLRRREGGDQAISRKLWAGARSPREPTRYGYRCNGPPPRVCLEAMKVNAGCRAMGTGWNELVADTGAG